MQNIHERDLSQARAALAQNRVEYKRIDIKEFWWIGKGGKSFTIELKDDSRSLVAREYNAEGQLLSETFYKGPKMHGPSIEYYEYDFTFDEDTQQVKCTSFYVKGLEHGLRVSYTESGEIRELIRYKRDELKESY